MSDRPLKEHIEPHSTASLTAAQCRRKHDDLLHQAEMLQPGMARQTVLLEAARYRTLAEKMKSFLARLKAMAASNRD